jgi:hypothetical protein
MFSMIALICYGLDRVISEYRTKQTKKELKTTHDYNKEEPSWNQSFA